MNRAGTRLGGGTPGSSARASDRNQGIVDLVGLIGHYTLKAFDVQRPPGSRLLLPPRPDRP